MSPGGTATMSFGLGMLMSPEKTVLQTEGVGINELLTDWLAQHRNSALAIIPLIAFLESCIGIGLFVSGLFLVLAASLLYVNELGGLVPIMLLALLGASLGDHVGYYVGRALGPGFHHLGVVQRHGQRLAQAETLVRRYGAYAIFIGRFIPAIRSLIPAMLGISAFARLRYTLLDLAACLLWALALGAIVHGAGRLLVA